jgi:hypothetical protein
MPGKAPLEVVDILTIAIVSGMVGGVGAVFGRISIKGHTILFDDALAFFGQS